MMVETRAVKEGRVVRKTIELNGFAACRDILKSTGRTEAVISVNRMIEITEALSNDNATSTMLEDAVIYENLAGPLQDQVIKERADVKVKQDGLTIVLHNNGVMNANS